MKIVYYISILLVLIIFSCKEKVDIELNNEEFSKLVVEGHITTEQKVHTIKLSRTLSYFDNQDVPMETGATVVIHESGSPIPFILHETSPGIYATDSTVAGKVGRYYTLNIKLQDGEEYSSKTYLDTCPPIDSISYEYKRFPRPHGLDTINFYIIKLYAQEPAGIGNNYMFNFYFDGVLDNDTLREAVYESDEYFDGWYLPGVDIYYIQDIDLINDSTRVKVEMLSIPYELIEYNLAVMLETDYRGSPFDGPPANIPSGISNGALGFFYASDLSSFELDIIKSQNQ